MVSTRSLARQLMFLIGCIGSRTALTYIAYSKPEYLQGMSIIAGIIAMGFLSIYMFGLRKTGIEVSGEIIWWNDFRPLHALLWGLFAYFARKQSSNAWKLLGLDTLIGLVLYLNHYS